MSRRLRVDLMSDEDGGTVTTEVQLKECNERLSEESERLLKLYDAYEVQEKETVNLKAEIEVLEKEIVEREIEKEGLEGLLDEKDNRLRELELRAAKSSKQVDFLEPELQKMEEKFTREKERLGKVFNIAEELDNDLRLAVTEMKARDDWYVSHMALFEDLNKAIKVRYELIEEAVEAERKSQQRQRAIEERMTEMVDARAAEMTIDEAETIQSPPEQDEAEKSEEEPDEAKAEEETSEESPAEDSPAEEEDNAETDEESSDETPDEDDPKPAPAADWGDNVDPWADQES